jgi:glucose/arabinose dehydrogenase
MRKPALIPALALLLFTTQTIQSQNLVYSAPVITGLSAPVDIVNAADGTNRLFVVQRGGIIKVYSSSYTFLGNLVTVADISFVGGSDERGLLSVAFHPDYENNRFFYVYYTTLDGSNNNYVNVARYQTRADNPNLADDTSRKVLLTIAKPAGPGFTNHNGARLLFGQDGYLYFATGDGGSGNDPLNNAQNGNSLLGKMIRLNVNTGATAYVAPYYTIPGDNPYVSDANVLDEIYAIGLRNPYRWSFDRLTGDMWIGDVGQSAREEIDYRAAGPPAPLNFGWRCYEGTIPNPNIAPCSPYGTHTPPIYDYPNPGTGAAVTGGHVYRGPDYGALQGVYIAADVYSGTHYKIKKTGPSTFNVTTQSGPTNIVAFGEAENGKLYAVSLTGSVSEVTTNSTLPVKLANFNAIRRNDHVDVSWKTASEINLKQFVLEYNLDGRSYQPAATIIALNNTNGAGYSVRHLLTASGVIYYRLKIENADGSADYSPVLTVPSDKQPTGANIPSIIRNNRLVITIYEPYTMLRVVSPAGTTLFSRNVQGMAGLNEITLPELPAGNYIVQLTGKGRPFSRRIVISR